MATHAMTDPVLGEALVVMDPIWTLFQKFGGPPGDRTRDTLIKSQVLYH